jgi:uncharacterized protein (TIGR02145 family)
MIVTDADDNDYQVVKIGEQFWMAENLKTTKYNDGTAIPLVVDNTEWSNITTPGYCWYDNDEASNKNIYGGLYNYYTVNTNKLCPTGWHVPSDEEWLTMIDYLGDINVAGGKLKERGLTHWNSPNTGATNESGFSALPGGYRHADATFYYNSNYGYWWSTTAYSLTKILYSRTDYNANSVFSGNSSMETGFSIRCIKD